MSGPRLGRAGAALPLVLVLVAVAGALSLTLVFVTTLDTLAARSAQEAARAEGQAEGALALAVAAAFEVAADRGVQALPATFGPWPGHGIDGTVEVQRLGPETVRLSARSETGRALAERSVTVRLTGGSLSVLARP